MSLLRLLPPRLKLWLTAQAIIHATQELRAQEVGLKLGAYLDTAFTVKESEAVQDALIEWLETVVVELEKKPLTSPSWKEPI